MLNNLEIRRKIFHILIGLVCLFLIYYEILTAFGLFLIIISGGLLSFISKRVDLPLISFFLQHFERKEERNSFPGRGALFLFVGFLLAIKLFPKEVALAAIAVVTLGDSFNHIFGQLFGHLPHSWNPKKMIEGSLFGLCFGFLGALFFVRPFEALIAALAGIFIEIIELDLNKKHLDDNFLVPLAAGAAILLWRNFLSFVFG